MYLRLFLGTSIVSICSYVIFPPPPFVLLARRPNMAELSRASSPSFRAYSHLRDGMFSPFIFSIFSLIRSTLQSVLVFFCILLDSTRLPEVNGFISIPPCADDSFFPLCIFRQLFLLVFPTCCMARSPVHT